MTTITANPDNFSNLNDLVSKVAGSVSGIVAFARLLLLLRKIRVESDRSARMLRTAIAECRSRCAPEKRSDCMRTFRGEAEHLCLGLARINARVPSLTILAPVLSPFRATLREWEAVSDELAIISVPSIEEQYLGTIIETPVEDRDDVRAGFAGMASIALDGPAQSWESVKAELNI